MVCIERNPEKAAKQNYDLIVVGGGIYGVFLSLEAARMGRRTLLVEKKDFGGATSFNSLRILHGGLRYLQSMDLGRFSESTAERSWFLRTFPELVQVMPCLMPLYGRGAKRPSIFWAALHLNDFLSRHRNDGVRPDRVIPRGKVISAFQTKDLFPAVITQGLKGGAVWYDVAMPDSQRLLIELLRWACESGVIALNYVEAVEILTDGNQAIGVKAIDHQSGNSYDYKGATVINAAGPWCRQLAAGFDRDMPQLFRPSLAWNVLFDRPNLSQHALAVAPKKPGGRIYFLVPWKGMLMAGTGHSHWEGSPDNPHPSSEQMQDFIDDLNLAVPSLGLSENDVKHVLPGLLPATEDHSQQIATKEEIIHHVDSGGVQGLYSVSGVKFTTARLVAEKTLKLIFPQDHGARLSLELNKSNTDDLSKRGLFDLEGFSSLNDEKLEKQLQVLITEEAVIEPDDLIYRRSNIWEHDEYRDKLKPVIERLIGSS